MRLYLHTNVAMDNIFCCGHTHFCVRQFIVSIAYGFVKTLRHHTWNIDGNQNSPNDC